MTAQERIQKNRGLASMLKQFGLYKDVLSIVNDHAKETADNTLRMAWKDSALNDKWYSDWIEKFYARQEPLVDAPIREKDGTRRVKYNIAQ